MRWPVSGAQGSSNLARLGAFRGAPDGTTLKGVLSDVRRVGVGVVAVMMLVTLGTLTWRQSEIYHDQGTFFTHIYVNAYVGMGAALGQMRRYAEALKMFEQALAPDSSTARANYEYVNGLVGK